jgi:hypothetical protein
MRNNLGMNTIDEVAFTELREGKPGKKTMAATPNYEIVSNMRYAEAFQYVAVDFRDTEEEKQTSDMVLTILNLAYKPESEANAFNFVAGASGRRATANKVSVNQE